MFVRPRLARFALTPVLAALLLSSLPAATASTASTATEPAVSGRSGGCRLLSDDGNKRKLFGVLTKRYEVKQIDQDENFSGAAKELTFVLEASTTASNSVERTGEVSASMRLGAFGSLEAKAGVNLGESDTAYKFSSTTEKLTLKTGDVYFRARGVRTYRLTTTFQSCRRRTQQMEWVTVGKAKAVGNLKVKGVVGCKQATTAGSFSRQIKNYCP